MRTLLSILVICFLITGCNSKLSFTEVSEDAVNKNIQSFIHDVKDTNGVHLFLEKQDNVYVFLNGSNVKQGEKAIHFTDFNVEEDGQILTILYNTTETTDYSNDSFRYKLLYEINLDKKYEIIKAINNGEEVSFDVISGNQ